MLLRSIVRQGGSNEESRIQYRGDLSSVSDHRRHALRGRGDRREVHFGMEDDGIFAVEKLQGTIVNVIGQNGVIQIFCIP